MMKRLLSLLLCMVMLLSMVPVQAIAQETAEESTELVSETEATEPVTEPVEETTAPTEALTEPFEETAAPTEAMTEPVEETTFSDVAMTAVASGTCGDNVTWTLDAEGTLTISGTGSMYYQRPWYDLRSSISTVMVEDGITYIPSQAFISCENLTDVWIGDSVSRIESYAFKSCKKLKTVRLPVALKQIYDDAFYGCESLEQIEIPDSVYRIGYSVFKACENLRTVHLPAALKEIGLECFSHCHNLERIEIPDNVTVIEDKAFRYCRNLESVQFPSSLKTIGQYAFERCHKLTEVVLPEGLGTLYSNSFSDCDGLTKVTLPDSLGVLQREAFWDCDSLRTLTIPRNVYSVGDYFVGSCNKLESVTFQGDAPSIASYAFSRMEIVAYYPEGNSTWTADVRKNYGGKITWLPYTPTEEPEEPSFNRHNTLESLTELDYLAFSQVAYEDFVMDESVQECLERTPGEGRNKWSDVWGEEGITYAELCEGIAEWKVFYIYENNFTGFYAVAFTNTFGEAVLAYRGSKPLRSILQAGDYQTLADWILNDLYMILYNVEVVGNQYDDVISVCKDLMEAEWIHTIVATGHSLGGLWGEIASAYSGCQAVTFNSISALDIMYTNHPIQLGRRFQGVDAWNFVDHVNRFDILAGMNEAVTSFVLPQIGTKLKPFIKHYSNYGDAAIFKNHGLPSLVSRAGDNLTINGSPGSWRSSVGISSYMDQTDKSIDMGTSEKDVFNNGLSVAVRRTSFGGDGYDDIITSIRGDVLVGGRDGDTLDGSWGDDTYYYFKDDGLDTIVDVSGDDKLYLKDFSDSDRIEVYDDPFGDYINILCNSEKILKIYKKNREYSVFTTKSFKFYVNDGPANDITYLFNEYKSGLHVVIRCPVSIEVLDSEGNVVYNLENNADAVGAHYTDYGNFYVFEEEEGGYGKVLDLAECYTIRIVGEDTGTMSIEYYDVKDGVLAEPKIIEDIPITSGYVANLIEDESGEVYVNPDNYVNYTYGQSAQIKLIEPWGLKANAKIMADEVLMDYDNLYDYGVYFIRKSDLDRAGLAQDTITVEDILNDTDAVRKTKADGVTVSGGYLSAIYDNDIYTYELDDSVFVMFYFVTNKGAEPIYVPIRERNLKTLSEQRMNDAVNFPNALERAVYQRMVTLEKDVADYRSDFANLSAPEKQKAPTLAQYPLGAAAAGTSYSYGQNAQIKLIEPWGLKANVKVSHGGSVIDYNAVEEYGIVALADNSRTYTDAAEILQNDNAYVFSSKNGDATISNGYISATYSKDIFTYQLDTDIYVFGYVKDADGYHYGPVRNRNVHTLMEARMNDAVNFPNVKERTVYTDMIELYDAITRYREDYFNN